MPPIGQPDDHGLRLASVPVTAERVDVEPRPVAAVRTSLPPGATVADLVAALTAGRSAPDLRPTPAATPRQFSGPSRTRSCRPRIDRPAPNHPDAGPRPPARPRHRSHGHPVHPHPAGRAHRRTRRWSCSLTSIRRTARPRRPPGPDPPPDRRRPVALRAVPPLPQPRRFPGVHAVLRARLRVDLRADGLLDPVSVAPAAPSSRLVGARGYPGPGRATPPAAAAVTRGRTAEGRLRR